MLDYKGTGLYMVSPVINRNSYNFDIPHTMRKHIIFHIALLDHDTPPTISQPPAEQQERTIDDCDEWEVNRILDSKRHWMTLDCAAHRAGRCYIWTSWEPVVNLENR